MEIQDHRDRCLPCVSRGHPHGVRAIGPAEAHRPGVVAGLQLGRCWALRRAACIDAVRGSARTRAARSGASTRPSIDSSRASEPRPASAGPPAGALATARAHASASAFDSRRVLAAGPRTAARPTRAGWSGRPCGNPSASITKGEAARTASHADCPQSANRPRCSGDRSGRVPAFLHEGYQ